MALLLSPMASTTRSNRRTDAIHPHHGGGNNSANAHFAATSTRNTQNFLHHANSSRTKRPINHHERDFDALKSKRAKIAVEILSKPPLSSPKTINTPLSVTPHPHPPSRPPNVATALPQTVPSAPTHRDAQQLTKHQEKVINGIKHELNKLQPRAADTKKEQGRKLRSQEATRFKSDLSAYFPDYDEVIGNDPKEHHVLNVDTPCIIIDSQTPTIQHFQNRQLALQNTTFDARPRGQSLTYNGYTVRGYGDALFGELFDSQRIDFSFLEAQYKEKTPIDPLPDEYFVPAHKKAERLEKSIRNTEKGRAQHEKDQIIRLLEGLQGHDWLRTMGVSGITESRKKSYEPARAYFIKGCQAILDKFRQWNLEEKRRKAEKDRALAEQAEAEEDEGDDAAEDIAVSDESDAGDDATARNINADDDMDDNASNGDPPDYSDVDASIARQLHDEAVARSRIANAGKKRSRGAARPPDAPIPEPPQEFTSFFKKKYEREGALSRHRRGGRKVVAWGQPIPEIPEADFDLPEEYRDSETMKSHARRKRRDRRGSRH